MKEMSLEERSKYIKTIAFMKRRASNKEYPDGTAAVYANHVTNLLAYIQYLESECTKNKE